MGTLRLFKALSVLALVGFISCSDDNADEGDSQQLSGEKVTLTIEIIPEGSGVVLPVSGTYTKGQQLTLRAIPNEGYLFSYWVDWIYSSRNIHSITMDSDKKVTAVFFKRNIDLKDLR